MPQFAVALPWWGYLLAFAVAIAGAWLAYRRVAVQLAPSRRVLLTTLRALTLVLIVIILLRPVRYVQAEGASESVVAILVDASRSMRLADADGPRIERARSANASRRSCCRLAKRYRAVRWDSLRPMRGGVI
jgi:hypothetical protein